MTTINQLSALDLLQDGDNFLVYDVSNGDCRRVSAATLSAYSLTQVEHPELTEFQTQYAIPIETGFTVTITDTESNVHLVMTPSAGFDSGTIVLPAAVDKKEVLVNTTRQVVSLTVDGNGAGVVGQPTALGSENFFRLKFDAQTGNWFRVG